MEISKKPGLPRLRLQGKKLRLNHFRVIIATAAGVLVPVLARRGLHPAGVSLMAAGIIVRCWSLGHLQKKKALLATTGPYALSRNPLYVGNVLLALGVGVATGSVWAALLFPAAAVVVFRYRIRSEETHLRKIHGAAFDAYCARTGRWLPRGLSSAGLPAQGFRWASFRRNHGPATIMGFLGFLLWWSFVSDILLPWLNEGRVPTLF